MTYHIFGEFPSANDAEIVSRRIKEAVSDITDIVITAKAIESQDIGKTNPDERIPYYTPDSVRGLINGSSETPHEAYLEVYAKSYDSITKAGGIMTSLGGLKIYRD